MSISDALAPPPAPPADPAQEHLRQAPLSARLAALQAMHAQLVVADDRDAAFATMTRAVRRLIGCDWCALYLRDAGGRLVLAAADGLRSPAPRVLEGGVTAAEQAFTEEYLVHVPDLAQAPGVQLSGHDVGSEVAVAVSSSRGPIGVFDLGSLKANAFDEQDLQLLRIIADQTAFSLENLRLLGELTATRDAVIHGMALLAESRDGQIGGHLTRICAYTRALAERLRRRSSFGVTEDWKEILARAAALHDIGKVSIPDSVLLKPGSLTPEEFEIMKSHTTLGAELLERLMSGYGSFPVLQLAAEVARGHHERWDGRGYPRQLAGEAIPLSARVVSICDVYDALTSRRVYKDALAEDNACEYLARRSGTRFDPRLVPLFLDLGPTLEAIRHANPD